jgi:Replication-relaxation
MGRGSTRHGTACRQGREPALSELDLRILGLLSAHRVLTQTQLAAISAGVPARTLRYRCNRLAKHGLLGRTRPYRERGSAPHHLWPTRRGEAMACGGPPPRGGERHEPNPLFLAHAAGLSEIYVALMTTLPAGFKLTRFEREAEAREPFVTRIKRQKRAIAPDAFIEIEDADGHELLAFIELDMGSMSHRRLKRKAAGYAGYVKAGAWRERHRFCPTLLFLATTEKRARSFLATMRRELDGDAPLLTSACDLAHGLALCATEPRWLIDDAEKPVDLLDALQEARRPYDEEMARRQARQREEETERERLLSDPEALRSHLRSWRHRDWGIKRLGAVAAAALQVTLEEDRELDRIEREALTALGAMFTDLLLPQLSEREPDAVERRAFDALARRHQTEQLERIAAVARHRGEGPALREARRRLEAGELLAKRDVGLLADALDRDDKSRAAQKRLRKGYLAWREQEAQRLVKAQGMLARLRSRPEDFFARIDRRSLRRCRACEQTAYPDPENARDYAKRHVATCCHYCDTGALAEIESSPDEGGRS